MRCVFLIILLSCMSYLNAQIGRPTVNPFSNGRHPYMNNFNQFGTMPFSFGNNNQMFPSRPSSRPTWQQPNNNGQQPNNNGQQPNNNGQQPNNNGQQPNNGSTAQTNSAGGSIATLTAKPYQINNGYAKGVTIPFGGSSGTNTTNNVIVLNTGRPTTVRLNLRNQIQMAQRHQLYRRWRMALRVGKLQSTRGNNNNGKNSGTQSQKQN